MVDAPCSGEGMFKIHESAMEEWSVEHVQACAKRQRNILESAYQMLKQECFVQMLQQMNNRA